jgi:hypothetical protein
MAVNPKRDPRKRNKDRPSGSIDLTSFATVASSSFYCGVVDQALICDSAFLAERGIFTRMEPVRHSAPPGAQAYNRRGQAAA